jgi:hypothetical protein
MSAVITNYEAAKAQFDSKIVIAATNATLNKTLTTVRKEAAKQIKSDYVVKVSAVKKAMSSKRSRFSTLFAELSASDVRLPLGLFRPSQKKKGVTVKIKRKEPRQILKQHFVATMANGHVGVFTNHRYTRRKVSRRKGVPRRGPRPTHSELPIDEAFTIGTPQMWRLEQSERVAKKRMEQVFIQEMNYRLNKLASKK